MIKHATPERVAFPVEALAQFMQEERNAHA